MADADIAKKIHYPGCWDVAAYPSLASALWEMVAWPTNHKTCCPTCGEEQG